MGIDHLHTLLRCLRRKNKHRGEIIFVHGRQIITCLLRRKIRDNGAFYSNFRHAGGKCIHAVFKENVAIGHEQKRNVKTVRHLLGKLKTFFHCGATVKGGLVGLEDHRPVRHGF